MLKLSPRLKTAAELVREGSRLADIGCDHGYIPVFLAENGIISYAVASDINEGPLSSCKALVEEMEIDIIDCRLSDGLKNIACDEIDDILIAGMGGELIVNILSDCLYIKKKHLIINPMTHPELVRKWLYNNGFVINNDIIVEDSNHYYSVFDADYKAEFSAHKREDYYLGNIKDFSNKEYFIHLLNYLNNKQKGGEDYSDIISAIKEKI